MPKSDDDSASSAADDDDDAVVSDDSPSDDSDSEDFADSSDSEVGAKRKRGGGKAAPKGKPKAAAAKAPAKPRKPAGEKTTPAKPAAKRAPAKKKKKSSDSEGEESEGEGRGGAGVSAARTTTSMPSAPSATASAAAAGVVASVAGKKITNEKQAEAVLLDYLNKSNRPYSALNVFDNLHAAVGKTIVPKLLDKLADAGTIKSKVYGKFKLYWPDQAQYGEVGEGEMNEWKRKASAEEATLQELLARKKELAQKIAGLSSALSGPELDAQLAAHRTSVAAQRERLSRLQTSGTPLVAPETRALVKAALERYRKAWQQRKRMVMEVVDSMAEGLEKKPRDLCELVGVETDEELKLDIKQFMA